MMSLGRGCGCASGSVSETVFPSTQSDNRDFCLMVNLSCSIVRFFVVKWPESLLMSMNADIRESVSQ